MKIPRKINNLIIDIKQQTKERENRNLILTIIYMIVIHIMLAVTFGMAGKNLYSLYIVLSFLLVWIADFYITLRFNNYRIMAVVSSLLYNLLLMPALFLLSGGILNGTVICFIVGITGTFFIISEWYVYIVAASELAFYIFILVFAMNNEEGIIKYYDMTNRTLGQQMSFFFAAAIPLSIIIYQSYVHESDQKNISASYRMIDEARKNKTRFLANISQELRMPMNAILGMNEIILRDEPDPVTKELSLSIKQSARQLLKIINNVVEYSKTESDMLGLYPEIYSFKDMISTVIDSFSREFDDRTMSFNAYIDPHIPEKLYGDKSRIKQIFMYLLFSTMGKNNNSRVSLSIRSSRIKAENTARISCRISVSGDGLSDSEIETMMSAYSKYDSRLKSEYKEMGLELSICRYILERMNGRLVIQSIEGIGSSIDFSFDNYIISDAAMIRIRTENVPTVLVYSLSAEDQNDWIERFREFKISLTFVSGPNAFIKAVTDRSFSQIFIPAELYDILKKPIQDFDIEKKVYVISDRKYVYGDYDKCRVIYHPMTSINVSEALNGIWDESKYVAAMKNEEVVFPGAKLLIVDDSIVNLKVLSGILKAYEIKPDTAKSAEEALAEIDKNFYDLIILDQIMPGIDGIELLHRIKKLANSNNKTPIVCATADFGQEVGRRLVAEGFCDYLAKPVQQFYLERILREYLPRELAQKPVKEEPEPIENMPVPEEPSYENEPATIDFAQGIEMTGGDKDAYGTILNSYLREGRNKIKDITEEHMSDNTDLYIIDVHALKSSSAAIGAKGISERFKALEFAGREGRKDFIDKNTDITLNYFETVLNNIEQYLNDEGMMESSVLAVEKDGEEEVIDTDLVLEMQDALNKINLRRCEEIINELNEKNFGTDINSIIAGIKNSYDMFDYPSAKTFIGQLVDLVSK